MATKSQAPAAAEQPEVTKTQELLEIGELCKQHKISRAVYAGVCAANGWVPGKKITGAAFLAAVERFNSAPIKKSEVHR